MGMLSCKEGWEIFSWVAYDPTKIQGNETEKDDSTN